MKKYAGKTHWTTMLGKDVSIELMELGPAVKHNLMCWLCNENKAVYDMNPNWCFRPCWDCQAKFGIGTNYVHLKDLQAKKWWEFWK